VLAGLASPGRIRVLQMVDTLDPGGMERVAVNLANVLRRDRFESALCTTRRDGALASLLAPDVKRLRLNRRVRFDLGAIRRLRSFIVANDIHVLHAHGSSLFTALCAGFLRPSPAIVWHDHYGPRNLRRSTSLYRLASSRLSAVVSVNQDLAEWARRTFAVPHDRVLYVPNFVRESPASGIEPPLPGRRGMRIVCVANLRPPKNHPDLVRAFAIVHRQFPDARLLLVGATNDGPYLQTVRRLIDEHHLSDQVAIMGHREDVSAILAQCDLGVLSSDVEGFPLALVEYGMAGLPVVASAVGQCPDILDGGKAGLITRPGDPVQLAQAMSSLLHSPMLRVRLGQRLRNHARSRFSQESVCERLCEVYETVAPSSRLNAVREWAAS
jgi:glycosyltransferase involved in cell wall biosynthesis